MNKLLLRHTTSLRIFFFLKFFFVSFVILLQHTNIYCYNFYWLISLKTFLELFFSFWLLTISNECRKLANYCVEWFDLENFIINHFHYSMTNWVSNISHKLIVIFSRFIPVWCILSVLIFVNELHTMLVGKWKCHLVEAVFKAFQSIDIKYCSSAWVTNTSNKLFCSIQICG